MEVARIWALGGHAHAAPADTLPAYWGALGAGAEGLAVTVRLTADREAVCVARAELTKDGKTRPVEALSLGAVRAVDAGRGFRSCHLNQQNRMGDGGEEEPWSGGGGWEGSLTHPTLERVVLHFARRTRLLLLLEASESRAADLAEVVKGLLERAGVLERTLIAGAPEMLAAFPAHPRLLLRDPGTGEPEALSSRAAEAGAAGVLVQAGRVPTTEVEGVFFLALPDEGFGGPPPQVYERLAGRPDMAGWVAPAVDRLRSLVASRGLVLAEDFEGPAVDASLWALGLSRGNDDTTIDLDHGLRIRMRGQNYSGGAAFSAFLTYGDFDARVSYEVDNPTQGTTLELAVVHIDAGYHRPNLTFDVHGAPPYASSERDEADGFRIGWNNGAALTRWTGDDPTSSNLYNNYSRNVGYAGADRPTGELRLTRSGEIFSAYYRDEANPAWILSGAAAVPALGASVFFRLGAKHWPKRGEPAPDNDVCFHAFRLYQW